MVMSRGATLGNGTVGFYTHREFRDFKKQYLVFTATIHDKEQRNRFRTFLERDPETTQFDPFSQGEKITFRAPTQSAD